MGSVLEDTPDLFGQRAAQAEAKLFEVRVDTNQVAKALAPILEEITAIQREIDTLTYKIIQAETQTEPTLFDLGGE